jgi:hypothetical protein
LATYTAQCACPRRPRPYCRDSAGAGPWEDRAGRCSLPGSTDRCLTGIPRLLAGAIRSPRRARCPDPAPLTTTPLRETCWGCRAWAEPHPNPHRPIGHDRAGSCACRHPVRPPRRANPFCALAGSRQSARKAPHTPMPAHRTSAIHHRRAGHSGRPEIGQE